MVQENFKEITGKATQMWNGTFDKVLEAFAVASAFNRDISGRSANLSSAITREGVQYLGDVQAALRQASEEARHLWTRQSEVVQEVPKDVMAASQKAVALYWDGAEQIARLGDAQREALTRYTGNVQNLLEKISEETRETFTKYSEQIVKLYGLKN